MAKIKVRIINKPLEEHLKRIEKRKRETKPYRIEAIISGTATISLRAKSKQGASKSGKKDLLTPNPEVDYMELRFVEITKITEETEMPGRWITPQEIMGRKQKVARVK